MKTTIKAQFQGHKEDLKTFLCCGIQFESSKKLNGNILTVTWVFECEANICSIFDFVSMCEMEQLGAKLISLEEV